MRKIVLLGATGSIGENTLKVVDAHRDSIKIVAIAANTRWEKCAEIANKYNVKHIAIFDEDAYKKARYSMRFPNGTKFYCGLEGLNEISVLSEANLIVSAIVGTMGLAPTLNAIEAGKDVAIASKEILVLAGKFVMAAATRKKVKILPLDSEHNAIFQCLEAGNPLDVEKIILTASGGIFRDKKISELKNVTPKDALKNPNWEMGPKVTIDSATMANKGLELIEATWLFDLCVDEIEIVIHPQSVVHSMVKFKDGSVIAQMAPPSMTFPIQHCLLYPERKLATLPSLDFTKKINLDFYPPNEDNFPCLHLAKIAARQGEGMPAIFNAANEVAVDAFLKEKIPYLKIPEIIEYVFEKTNSIAINSLEDVLEIEFLARKLAIGFIK